MDTILQPLIGGALIGLGASILMLFNGRILGISGIFGTAIKSRGREGGWRMSFVAGLLAGGLMLLAVLPSAFDNQLVRGTGTLIAAGLLVGFGTRLGSGCTSGHGVCGLSRVSPRSIVATLTFMGAGAIAASVAHHFVS
ncbi:MAG: YeeE/YedE family protein [Myxococcales bacterium]|nr:YeeE/YedE family protein [Myxococcales bacterium]